jgi:hypothetical protein
MRARQGVVIRQQPNRMSNVGTINSQARFSAGKTASAFRHDLQG